MSRFALDPWPSVCYLVAIFPYCCSLPLCQAVVVVVVVVVFVAVIHCCCFLCCRLLGTYGIINSVTDMRMNCSPCLPGCQPRGADNCDRRFLFIQNWHIHFLLNECQQWMRECSFLQAALGLLIVINNCINVTAFAYKLWIFTVWKARDMFAWVYSDDGEYSQTGSVNVSGYSCNIWVDWAIDQG